jgi:hypothetical protein
MKNAEKILCASAKSRHSCNPKTKTYFNGTVLAFCWNLRAIRFHDVSASLEEGFEPPLSIAVGRICSISLRCATTESSKAPDIPRNGDGNPRSGMV